MKNADRDYLAHILDAIADIESYASAGQRAFFADRMRQDAVIRKTAIIGEAARHLSEAAKGLAPEIPWRSIIGTRDRLVHGYFRVDLNLVWTVIMTELPRLRSAVERLTKLE